jgi:pimeloyl-ACP methyl ester carboxylesterase
MIRLHAMLVALLVSSLAHGAPPPSAPSVAKAVPPAPQPACATPQQRLDEQGFVPIGGIEQWVTIKGDHCDNPVILMVHGGPGNPNTVFDRAGWPYGDWEKDFTLVQWDQRGAGMTWGRNRPTLETKLTIEQLRDDGLAVARYVTQHLGKRKLILFGSSWGSYLAVNMLTTSPEPFCAYVGTAQLVVGFSEDQTTYARLLALARAAGDQDSLAKLEALGPPPWTNPRNPGILRRLTRKYEAMTTEPTPKSWWRLAPQYATPQAQADYEEGEEYSWLQFVGLEGDGLFRQVDLYKLGKTIRVPFYLIQGTEDLVTPADVTQKYYDSISAPVKDLVLLPRTGHDPNRPMVEAQARILRERVRKSCL